MITHPKGYKFGKLPSTPRTGSGYVQLTDYQLKGTIPAGSYIWTWQNVPWGMALNDQIGDCVIAGASHEVVNWTYQNNDLFVPPNSDLLSAYKTFCGYQGTIGTDNGCDMTAVEGLLQSTGISGHKVDAFALVDPTNTDGIKNAITWFGSCKLGITIPVGMNFLNPDESLNMLWDIQPGMNFSIQGEGHCVLAIGWDGVGIYVVSWGTVYQITWALLVKILNEAIAAISLDWLNNKSVAPNGLNLSQLNSDLGNVQTAWYNNIWAYISSFWQTITPLEQIAVYLGGTVVLGLAIYFLIQHL